MPKFISAVVASALVLGACATNSGATYRPIVDGPLAANYESDLAACQQVAQERSYLNDDVKNDAMIGAGIGALAGVLDNSDDLEGLLVGGLVGAIAGGGASSLETRDQRRQIVVFCMRDRGPRVVG